MKNPVAKKVQFVQLSQRERSGRQKPGLDFYQGIPLIVSGELGTTTITVRELLALQEGSIIKLNKMAGDSAAVLVNDKYLGQAEVVVVNDRFGLRIMAIGKNDVENKNPGE